MLLTVFIWLATLIYYTVAFNDPCRDIPCTCCSDGRCTLNDDNQYVCRSCIDGYTGSKCEEPCPENCFNCTHTFYISERICFACRNGYYKGRYKDITEYPIQNDCSLSCTTGCESCTSYHSCNRCEKGYFPSSEKQCIKCMTNCAKCSDYTTCEQCKDRYFVENDYCRQCQQHCKTCIASQQCSVCELGYYLDGHGCKQCHKECLGCISIDTCSSCQNGHHLINGQCLTCGSNCIDCTLNSQSQVICGECQKGFYVYKSSCSNCGTGCEVCKSQCINCPEHCIVCTSPSTCMECEVGYKGETCQEVCSNCKKGTRCEKSSGYCFEECKEGLSGPNCDLTCDQKCSRCTRGNPKACQTCAHNRYGVSCTERCSQNCLNGSCFGMDGSCSSGCVSGHWGPICEHNCSSNCGIKVCDRISGYCLFQASEETKGTSSKNIGLIFGVASACIIALLAALVAVLIKCRKKITRPTCICSWRKHRNGNLVDRNKDVNVMNKNECKDLVLPRTTQKEILAEERPLIVPTFENMNINDKPTNNSIKVTELAKYVAAKTKISFCKEFFKFKIMSKDVSGTKQSGSASNRMQFEVSQVGLPVVLEKPCKAPRFINANSIDGGSHDSKTYIAYMGSVAMSSDEMEVFWKIVWQERCRTVVMLGTQSLPEEKCTCTKSTSEPCSVEYQDLTVVCHGEQTFAGFTIRKYTLKKHMKEREVQRLQFSGWPLSGLPEVSSFVQFVKYANKVKQKLDRPTMVYCRCEMECTGIYIALDILTKQGKDTGWVDIQGCVRRLLEQRVEVLKDYEQYMFLHKALVCSLT